MPVNLCLSIITDNYNNCNIITVSPQNVRGLKPFFLFCCLYLSQIPVCKHKTEPTFSVQMSHQPLKPVEVLLCTSLLSVYNSTSELCLINIGEEAVEDRWWIMRKKFRLWTDVHLGTQLWASAWENTASRQRRDSNPCSVSSASPLCLQPPEDGGEDSAHRLVLRLLRYTCENALPIGKYQSHAGCCCRKGSYLPHVQKLYRNILIWKEYVYGGQKMFLFKTRGSVAGTL